MTAIKKELIVPYSCEQMFNLVNDIERYPEFLDWCSCAEIIEYTANEIVAELTISYSGIDKSFTTRNSLMSSNKIMMNLVEGPFKHLTGSWDFIAINNQGCKVEFKLDFEFSNYFVSLMFGKVFQEIAEKIVNNFSKRAQDVYG